MSTDDAVAIRRGVPNDAAMLATLGARIFAETFGPDNRPEDIATHLASTYGVAQQTAELTDPSATFLVAEYEGKGIGYALLRRSSPPASIDGPHPIEISRFYVDRPWHGTSVARRLMAECEAEARRGGAATLWLGVWERNPRAIRFYEKCGLRDVGSIPFRLGADVQTDRVLVKDLLKDF